jgi:predicted ester cyclase
MTGSGTELVRALIERFVNGHDADLASEFYAPELVWHGGSVGTLEGAELYATVMRGFFNALPDVQAVEQDVIESGDKVVLRLVVDATHKGELWGIQGTGRHLTWDATITYRIQGDKIVEQWAAEDWTAILQGMGVFTPPWVPQG